MYEEELKRVNKKIKKLVQKNKLKGKKVYLFGVSENTRKIIQILKKYDIEPTGIIDNDKLKQGSYCSSIKVLSPLQVEVNDNLVILIYSAFWIEMKMQLENMRICSESIYRINKKRESITSQIWNAVKGKWIYSQLIHKYGNIPVFLCPYTGTGDIYLIGTFWSQYIEENQIDSYIFLVVSSACRKVAEMFSIKNIEILPQKKCCQYLLSYYMLCPKKIDLKVLNDSWWQIHTNPIEWFRGYKGLNFTEMFRKYVFNLPDNSLPRHPKILNIESEIEKLFKTYKLRKGKTVVLSPYSNTLSDLPEVFWIKLAEILKQKGYDVCTNSSGNDEPAVKETISVFPQLNIAPKFIEMAGFFIGIRSGFCDVISSAKAKIIILYDAENRFYNSSSYEYFSLKKMGLSETVSEIQFFRNSQRLLQEVMNELMKEK